MRVDILHGAVGGARVPLLSRVVQVHDPHVHLLLEGLARHQLGRGDHQRRREERDGAAVVLDDRGHDVAAIVINAPELGAPLADLVHPVSVVLVGRASADHGAGAVADAPGDLVRPLASRRSADVAGGDRLERGQHREALEARCGRFAGLAAGQCKQRHHDEQHAAKHGSDSIRSSPAGEETLRLPQPEQIVGIDHLGHRAVAIDAAEAPSLVIELLADRGGLQEGRRHQLPAGAVLQALPAVDALREAL